MAKVPKKQNAKPPAMDKLLKPAIGVALAMMAYYFMKGVTSEITRVDVNDALALREVFFGEGASGKDYAVSYRIALSVYLIKSQVDIGLTITTIALHRRYCVTQNQKMDQ
jgi:hypothetical protein